MTVARSLVSWAAAALALSAPRPHPRADIFAPGVISTRDYERDGSFSPDGKSFYFTKRTMWPYFSAICVSRLHDGAWSEPEIASFSGQFGDATPFVSTDGKRLYFASRRPVNGVRSTFYTLWMTTRNSASDRWSEPTPLPAELDGKEGAIAPVETRDGSLYFVSGELGHVVVARHGPNGWTAPVAAGDSSETGSIELGAYVDPDQRYMIVSVVGRADALHSAEAIYPRADLYVRTRTHGHWSALRHLDAPINSGADELAPFVSPDGRYLYFTSERGAFTEHGTPLDYGALEATLHAPGNGLGDIYRIELASTGLTQ